MLTVALWWQILNLTFSVGNLFVDRAKLTDYNHGSKL